MPKAKADQPKPTGRPKGATDTASEPSHSQPTRCAKCFSTNREAYGKTPHVTFYHGTSRIDGKPYTRIIRRRTRCSDCGQGRVDMSYEFHPEDLPRVKK